MASVIARSKAAKKAALTRAANRAWQKRWETVERPARDRFILLCNELLSYGSFDVGLCPLGDSEIKLKHGATKGRIVKFIDTQTVRVLPVGYKRPQDFPWSYWEPIL